MILVAGGRVDAMEDAALALFEAGHIPLVGEWLASPMIASRADGVEEVLSPLSERLLLRCDALLRLPGGPGGEADAITAMARSRGMRVFFSVDDAIAG